MSEDDPVGRAGYRQPPSATQFRKGQSGNPRGRPRGSRSQAPYEAVLGQMVTIRENGVERRVTAAEAFLLHMTKRALEGDGAAARASMAAIEDARAKRLVTAGDQVTHLAVVMVTPGSVNTALEPLRMAVKQDRYRPTARMKIEPWLIGEALLRLGDRRLTLAEQTKVYAATSAMRRCDSGGTGSARCSRVRLGGNASRACVASGSGAGIWMKCT